MVDINAWLASGNTAPNNTQRAVDAWKRINDKPVSITVNRNGTALATQTVRVEYSESERVITGEANGMSAVRDVVVFGVKNHPSVTDTNLQYGDLFAYDGQIFKVVFVISSIGEIQANCEAVK
jgi:hypothetical protein